MFIWVSAINWCLEVILRVRLRKVGVGVGACSHRGEVAVVFVGGLINT